MPPHLPDEIISEILSPVLHVPDELFSSQAYTFSNRQSSSQYLLVCKSWFRVATPLLYKVVILRSTAQATALATTLKAVPDLGRFVKKLRVEGGYGASMYTILKSVPNITDLCLSFAIWLTDSTTGLRKGLALIDPRRLIIMEAFYTRSGRQNKHLNDLRQTVLRCLRSWNNLRVLGYPYGSSIITRNQALIQRALDLNEALLHSQVHTIVLSDGFFSREIPTFIISLCDIPALRNLQFKRPFSQRDEDLVLNIGMNPRLKGLAQYTFRVEETQTGPEVMSSSNPHFVPMQFASEHTREIVWKRVIFFAMSMDKLRSPSVSWERYPSPLPILTVSKYFHRFALPYLYECIPLTPENCSKISAQLLKRPYLGSFIRRVFTFQFFRALPPLGDDAINAILSISQHARNLEVFTPHPTRGRYTKPLPMEALRLLAANAGRSLQHLSLESLPQVTISASFLESFPALRILEWQSGIEATGVLHPDSFTLLHTLDVREDSSGTIFRLLTDTRLPCFRVLSLTLWVGDTNKAALVGFLRVHGPKVLRLTIFSRLDPPDNIPVLDLCPNLTEVEIIGQFHISSLVSSAQAHNSLTKMVAYRLPDPKHMGEMISNPAMLPALREIQVDSLCWPKIEREISKSLVVPIAESLLRHNIKIVNGEGRSWTPRLKIERVAGQGRSRG